MVKRTQMQADLTRPIIGIENRTAQEVFDIMCDRIRSAEAKLAGGEAVAWTSRANLRELHNDAGVYHAVMGPKNTAEMNVPLYTRPAPTHNDGSGEADLKRAYLMGREQWCPAGILSDTARTERDWQRSRAVLRGDATCASLDRG